MTPLGMGKLIVQLAHGSAHDQHLAFTARLRLAGWCWLVGAAREQSATGWMDPLICPAGYPVQGQLVAGVVFHAETKTIAGVGVHGARWLDGIES